MIQEFRARYPPVPYRPLNHNIARYPAHYISCFVTYADHSTGALVVGNQRWLVKNDVASGVANDCVGTSKIYRKQTSQLWYLESVTQDVNPERMTAPS